MSSSEVLSPPPRHRWRWLVILIILLATGYCAGWFFVADKIDERIGVSLSRLAEKGVVADCRDRQVDGFPISLGLTCDSITYDDAPREISFTTGALSTRAMIYNPLRAKTELDSPLRLQSPDFPPLLIGWENLTAEVRVARPVPSEITLAATALTAETDPDDETDPAKIFSAASVNGVLTPDGQNLVWNGSFDGLAIDPAVIEGRIVPPLAGLANITMMNGVTMLTDRPKSLRGQSFEVTNLALAAGEGSVAVSGPIAIDEQGLIDARLEIKLINPAAISTVLQAAVPEKASEIRTGFVGLAFLGKEPSIPFRIAKGKPLVLGFALGDIPPLQ